MHNNKVKKTIIIIASAMLLSLCACGQNTGTVSANLPSASGDVQSDEGNSQSFTGSNYADAYDLKINAYEDVSCDGIIYYGVSPEEYNKVTDCIVETGDVSSVSSDGITQLTIPLMLTMTGEYTDECISYTSAITPAIDLADRYTGLIIPTGELNGDDGFSYSVSVPYNDDTINISLACDVTDTMSEYRTADDGSYVCDIIFNVTYTIAMPDDYDGLIFKITPVREYVPETEDADGDISGNECILDDYPDGTILMEIK